MFRLQELLVFLHAAMWVGAKARVPFDEQLYVPAEIGVGDVVVFEIVSAAVILAVVEFDGEVALVVAAVFGRRFGVDGELAVGQREKFIGRIGGMNAFSAKTVWAFGSVNRDFDRCFHGCLLSGAEMARELFSWVAQIWGDRIVNDVG